MKDIFEILWQDYCTLNPQAEQIVKLLIARGENIVNDHIALRTINEGHCDIEIIAAPFLNDGYTLAQSEYHFPEKKLYARHLHKEGEPLIFISALQLSALSNTSVQLLGDMVAGQTPNLRVTDRPWVCTQEMYKQLQAESEYAAWFAAFGWRANHFTINVNALSSFEYLEDLTFFLQEHGFPLNESGGIIKGSIAEGLRQASTMAARKSIQFSDGYLEIPSCYMEFAERFPVNGENFTGFIAASADKIFESTDS